MYTVECTISDFGGTGGREMCELKKAIWREYDAEIKEALSSSEKVRNIPIPNTEKERNT